MLIGCDLGHRYHPLEESFVFLQSFPMGNLRILYWDPGFIVRGKKILNESNNKKKLHLLTSRAVHVKGVPGEILVANWFLFLRDVGGFGG